MKKKLVPTIMLTLMLTLILASALGFTFDAARIRSLSPSIWYVDWRYPTYGTHRWIHDAINDPKVADGDIIRVMWGLGATPYTERVKINKSVTIVGYDGRPIIDGGGTGAVFNVTVRDVALFNLIIRNGRYGINLFPSAANSNVTNNFVTNNTQYGIYVNSENNTIKGNTLTTNGFGISVGSSGNFLRNNNMTNNTYNFGISNFVRNDVDSSNTINTKRVYIWINEHYRVVPPDAGYVAVVNSTDIIVKNLKLSNNDYGVQFVNTSISTIENVEVARNYDGIYLLDVTNSKIDNVNASYNVGGGIYLKYSYSNLISNNVMLNNSIGIDLWDSGNNLFTENLIQSNVPYGTGVEDFNSLNNRFYHNNIKNNQYQVIGLNFFEFWDNGAEGNYWSDYLVKNPGVKDANGDGIWDHYYEINPNNIDRYPLVKPWKSVRVFNVAKTWPKSAFPGYTITVSSDHVIASLNFTKIGAEVYPRLLSFNITAGSSGFVNITIPRAWLDGPFTLWVNDVQRGFDILIQNASHSILYFTYTVGKHQVKIIGIKSGTVFGDLNGDGKIDIKDIAMVAKEYGEQLPPSNLTPTDITEYDP